MSAYRVERDRDYLKYVMLFYNLGRFTNETTRFKSSTHHNVINIQARFSLNMKSNAVILIHPTITLIKTVQDKVLYKRDFRTPFIHYIKH